tara:strand:+ start:939 stop:1685 length:747 start_codon:yes stop_codon:yes gene_type:complete
MINHFYAFTFIFGIVYNLYKLNYINYTYEIIYGGIIGYYLGGFISALIHWFLDSYNFKILEHLHKSFRNHHENPTYMLEKTNLEVFTQFTIISFPFFFFLEYTNNQLILSTIIIALLIGISSQLIHKYSHLRNHQNDKDENGNYLYPRINFIIKKLQDYSIILHPKDHSDHHEKEIINYSVAHSNSDKLFEYFIIDILGFRSSYYYNNNNILVPLYQDRYKYIKRRTLYDIIKEQKILIISSILYFFL